MSVPSKFLRRKVQSLGFPQWRAVTSCLGLQLLGPSVTLRLTHLGVLQQPSLACKLISFYLPSPYRSSWVGLGVFV